MMIAADQHFDRPGADLCRADEGAERDGRRQRDVAGLQDGQQMNRDHGRDHRGDGDRRGEQDEEHHGAGRQGALRPTLVAAGRLAGSDRMAPGFARQSEEIERQERSPDGSPHRSGRRPRHPKCETSKAESGQQAVLAKPPNKVSVAMARARALAVEPAEGGERGVVKTRAHAEAEHQPGAR